MEDMGPHTREAPQDKTEATAQDKKEETPQDKQEETAQDKKEETAQDKAISLSMVSLVAAAETVGGFGPFSDTQVELPCQQE